MKRLLLTISVLGIVFILSSPFAALAQDSPNYVTLKLGAYYPTGDLDDADFDAGFNGEVAYGYHFMPNFALEGGLGYFRSSADFSGFDPVFGVISEEDDIWAMPLTVTAKGIIPLEPAELYGGIGIGVYFTSFEGDITIGALTASVDSNDIVLGGHLVLGANVDIATDVFLGIEGKYIVTDNADFTGTPFGIPVTFETDLNGMTLTGNIGFRF